ncbi:MAG: 1,4-alpha-glucan branching protein domain-containing protein, partial [Promethearchaeota archaeon]
LSPKFTIDISPVLCEMLAADVFKTGFVEYCKQKIHGAQLDYMEFDGRGDLEEEEREKFLRMAKFWEEFYGRTIEYFKNDLHQEILSGFKKLQDLSHIDITTCAATHGYAPLLSRESSINAQFKVAVDNYKKHFGRAPAGTWLAECAYRPGYKWKKPMGDDEPHYRPGIEKFLSKNNLQYFFVDTALLMGGTSQGVYAARFPLLKALHDQMIKEVKQVKSDFARDPLEPYLVATQDAENLVAAFVRDENTGILVWSGEHGYPATGGAYLDFHKKHYKDSMGGGSGLRYWRITSPKADMGSKEQYNILDIEDLLNQNAGHYKEAIKGVLNKFKAQSGKPGHLIAMYDAELFGHWWFEGPWFINRVIRFTAQDPEIDVTNCRDYLEKNGLPNKTVNLAEGSWGQGSSHYIWLNKENSWTWPKIYEIEDIVEDLATKYHAHEDKDVQRLLKQLGRENLVLQSSDWQFLISTWSARDYAEARFDLHYDNCKRIASMIERQVAHEMIKPEEWTYFASVEQDDSLFKEIDVSAWVKDAWKEEHDKK